MTQRANEYNGAPTPYTAPTPYSAPTPAGNAAPTPAAYPSGPTPAASAQTPGAGLSYQTPGLYAGAATTAAEPLEYHERGRDQNALPKDWVVAGVRAIVEKSDFQANRLIGQYGKFRHCSQYVHTRVDGCARPFQQSSPNRIRERVQCTSSRTRRELSASLARISSPWLLTTRVIAVSVSLLSLS